MPTLEELLNSGLGGILQSGGVPLEEDLYQRQAQAERESSYGRGLGISSVTRDALAKARMDAAMAAQQAQLAALGQAAGVTQATANREASMANSAANRNQQESQFRRTQQQQSGLANQQLLAGGLGAGVGALGQVAGSTFGPEIRTGLRKLGGLGPLRQDAVPPGVTPGPVGEIPSGDFQNFTLGGDTSLGGLGDLGALGAGGGGDFSFSPSDYTSSFNPSDYSFDAGGLDLSGLYDLSFGGFDPYQNQDWGWY